MFDDDEITNQIKVNLEINCYIKMLWNRSFIDDTKRAKGQ